MGYITRTDALFKPFSLIRTNTSKLSMQSYRTISRLPIAAHRTLKLRPQAIRKMSIFPRAFVGQDPTTSFTPLFRLLDDFDAYTRTSGNSHHRGHLRTFSPRFDVREVEDAYELHGELPGIDQKNVDIEFTDLQTITIRGRSERSYTSGTPPAGLVKGGETGGAITEGEEANKAHQATVEDEEAGTKAETSVATTEGQQEQEQQQQRPQGRFWVSERSVGEFARSFNFPTRIDQDNVKASMKNGILTILVPKIKKHESRKILIS
jgi:HSP20 family protein